MTTSQPGAAQQPVIPIPSRVPIQPIPTVIDLDIMPAANGQQAVFMRIQDLGGVKIVVLTAEQAKALGEQMRNAGTRAAVGLVVPTVRLP